MTKGELEKEVEDRGIKYADSLKMDIKVEDGVEGYAWYQVEQAYEKGALDFVEPREKQIEIDAEQIRALQKQNGELTDKVRELEAQIEKLKCCENCGWFYLQQHWRESEEINKSRMFHCGTCGNKKNWKLKEIKEK